MCVNHYEISRFCLWFYSISLSLGYIEVNPVAIGLPPFVKKVLLNQQLFELRKNNVLQISCDLHAMQLGRHTFCNDYANACFQNFLQCSSLYLPCSVSYIDHCNERGSLKVIYSFSVTISFCYHFVFHFYNLGELHCWKPSFFLQLQLGLKITLLVFSNDLCDVHFQENTHKLRTIPKTMDASTLFYSYSDS